MCRWGCETMSTTFMCKWCGTWFCRECMRGAFQGTMKEPLKCRVCNQRKCQGTKVDFLTRQPNVNDENEKNMKGGKSAGSARGRSASPSKSAKSAKGGNAPKSAKKTSGGKKSGKKKKKK